MAFAKPKQTHFSSLVILFPILIIIGGLFLFIFIAPGSYAQIVTRIESYKKDKETYDTLQKKLTVLQTTSPSVLDKTTQAVGVMPEKNPVLSFISQMKNIAIEKNITISSIKSNNISDTEGENNRLELEVSMEGESYDAINELVLALATRAPIMTVDEVQMVDQETSKSARMKASLYWSNLPETLPPVTDALPAFSPDELTTLDRISTYTLPEFSTLSPGVNTAPRENPFN